MPKSNSTKNYVFIVSAGRTGTTFFGNHLKNVISDCTSFHEPDIYHGLNRRTWESVKRFGLWHVIIGRYFGLTGIRNIMMEKLNGEWDSAQVTDSLIKHRRSFYEKQDASLIIESYGKLGFLLPELTQLYPDAKTVTVVRDPRDWVRSQVNFGRLYEDTDPVQKMGQARLSPDMVGDEDTAKAWPTMSPFDKLCWSWTFTNQKMFEFTQGSSRAKLFKFETLFSEGSGEVEKLVQFCATFNNRIHEYDLSKLPLGQSANASRGKKQSAWQDWDTESAKTLEHFCGPLMRQLGYGLEPEWQMLIGTTSSAKHVNSA